MPRDRDFQPAFNAGELSPRMAGRLDLPQYGRAAEEIRNLIVTPQGGVTRAPGTRFVGFAKEDDRRGRLVPFVFSDSQAYVLIFGDRNVRFGMNKGIIKSGGAIYEIATPWPDDALRGLEHAQTNDVVYFAQESSTYPMQVLGRTGHAAWTLTEYAFKNGPWMPVNTTAVTLKASAATGTVTVEASAPLFKAGHVGALFRLDQTSKAEISAWEQDTGYSLGAIAWYGDNVYECIDAGNAGQVPPVHLEGDAWDGEKDNANAVKWRYLHSGFGIVRITSVTSETEADATVEKRLPADVVDPNTTERWREGAWSTERGWSGTLTFADDRLASAASKAEPQAGWLTVAGAFDDYDIGRADADDALTFRISSRQADPIRGLAEGPSLVVLAATHERVLFSAEGGPLAPDGRPANRAFSSVGANFVTPVGVGGSLLFINRSGYRLHEIVFAGESDRFTTIDRSKLADHILRPDLVANPLWNWQPPEAAVAGETDATAVIETPGGEQAATSYAYGPPGAVAMAWAADPIPIAWIVRADGLLVGFTHLPDERIHAFWRRAFKGGAVESIAVIPDPETGEDQVWLLMIRTLNGVTRRTIEVMEPLHRPADETDMADCWHLDCALKYEGAPATTLSGLDHLEGESVQIWADGAEHPDRTVTGGQITLERAASTAIVGINSPAYLRMLPAARGVKHQAKVVTALVRETIRFGVSVDGGPIQTNTAHIAGRPFDEAPRLVTGEVEIPLESAPGDEQRVAFHIDHPGPFSLEMVDTDLRRSTR